MAVVVIDTIKPKNQGTFPVVEAADVKVTNDKRLDTALNEKANASTVEALSTAVAGKASQSDVTALQTAVAGKASQSDLTALSNTVADKADKSALAETNTAVAGKQAALTEEQLAACNSGITSALVTQIGTNTTAIAGKADSADLATTNAAVATKAEAADVATETANLQNQINNIVSGSTADSEVINARVGEDGTSYATLKARLDSETERNSINFIDLYDADFDWEAGSIDTSGNEVSGDRNNFRTKRILSSYLRGKTISVKNESRYIAVAYYNGNTFVSRSSFSVTSITISESNTYDVRIVISNKEYSEGDTLADVLEGIELPDPSGFKLFNTKINNLSADNNAINEKIAFINTGIDNIYNFDFHWESGSIDASGNEVSGDKNNYRTALLESYAVKGKTISVKDESRYIAVAYYNGSTFVSRTSMGVTDITIPANTTYNVRIVVANKEYVSGATLSDVLEGVILPEIGSLEPLRVSTETLSSDLSDLKLEVHGNTTEITYTDGVIDSSGIVNPEPTVKGNCMSRLIKADEYQRIDITIDSSNCTANYCLYQNGNFVERASWITTDTFSIPNNGYDVVILFASRSVERTKEQVLDLCSASIYYANIDNDIAELQRSIPNLAFMNKIICCDTGRNIIHYSVDDVWICLYDIITHNYESIYENSFFAALKSLHETYGICVTLNTFNSFSETPAYDISDLPNTYQSELQEAKSWLKFAFHAESDLSNYSTSTGISAAYDKFVSAIYTFTGDYDCIDPITRLGYFAGTLANVLTIKNKQHGIIGLLCADSTNRDSYYLNEAENALVQSKGKYYDLNNELVFIKTIKRDLYTAAAEIENNPCYQKFVEIFCHEYESSAPTIFTNIAQYASTKGYMNAFPGEILK